MKRFFALLLAAAMVMSLAAVTASADEPADNGRERPSGGFEGRGRNDGRGRNNGRGAGQFYFGSEDIAAKIEAVENDEVKAELNVLFENWTGACEEHKAALDKKDELTKEELMQLMQNARDAHKALISGLKDAEVEIEFDRPEMPRSNRQRKGCGCNCPCNETAGGNTAENADESKSANEFMGWLSGLFN